MRVLVTGGTGFIGSHVVDALRDRGITVRVFDLVKPGFRDDIEFNQGTLLDLESLRIALNGVDAVYHLAAVADVKDVFSDPYYAESINTRGTINVLEAMRRAGVKRLIYGSTTWVYSDTAATQVDEETLLPPPSHLYTATKLASEYYSRSYSVLFGIEPTILRYGIPYGPRARAGAVVPIFVEKALHGQPITIAGDGSQFRYFVYVEDLAAGNVLALRGIAKRKTYNLDGAEPVTIRRVAEVVKDVLGNNVRIEFGPARPGDFGGKVVSSRRALEELGWKPRVSFEDGVRRYIEWRLQAKEEKNRQWAQVDAAFLAAL